MTTPARSGPRRRSAGVCSGRTLAGALLAAGTAPLAAGAAPPPPGLEALVSPADAAPESTWSLQRVRRALADAAPPLEPASTANDASPAASVAAYARGRIDRLFGDERRALVSLREAVALDPTSPEAWREFVGALGGAGANEEVFEAACRRLLDLDPSNAVAGEALARGALRRGDLETAAAILCDVIEPARAPDTRLLDLLAGALRDLGYRRAAAEALEIGLSVAEPSAARTHRAWSAIGDARLALDQADAAAEAYQRASIPLDAIDDHLLARRVYAELLAGRAAEAARVLADVIADRRGAVSNDVIRLVRYLHTQAPDIGLLASIDAAAGSLDAEARSRTEPRLLLCRAAAMTPADARAALTGYLEGRPSDDAVLVARMALVADADPAEQLLDAIGLARALPAEMDRSPTIARLLTPPAPSLADAWLALPADQQQDDAALAVGLRILMDAGRRDAGLAAIPEAPGVLGPRSLAPAVRLCLDLALLERAEAILVGAEARDDWAMRLAVVQALAEWRRHADVLGALDRLDAEPAPALVRPRLADLRAEALVRMERWAAAHAVILESMDAWPDRERPGLLLARIEAGAPVELHPARTDAVIRERRSANPSSVALRFAASQRAARAGDGASARRLLRGLVVDAPDQRAFALGLVEALIEDGGAGDARAFAEQRLETRPGSSFDHYLLTMAAAAQDRPGDAVDRLRRHMAAAPGDDIAARALTYAFSQAGRSDDAMSNELMRLSLAPEGFATSLGLARIHAWNGRADVALGAVREAVEHLGGDASPAQARALEDVFARLGVRALNREIDGPSVAEGVERLNDRIGPLSSHTRRLGLQLAAADRRRRDFAELVHIAEDVARHDPASGEATLIMLSDALWRRAEEPLAEVVSIEAGPGRWSLEALERAARRSADPVELLERMLIRITERPGLLPAASGSWLSRWSLLVVERGVVHDVLPRAAARWNTLPSELAGALANRLDEPADWPAVEAFFEFALALDPQDVLINNNFGYRLLERNEQIDRAVALIETAYRNGGAGEAYVVDSLGWARYKLGRFDDEGPPGPDGETPVERLGAVSLLRRAAELADRDAANAINAWRRDADYVNLAVVTHHLADALWRAGRAEDAERAWEEAKTRADLTIRHARTRLSAAQRRDLAQVFSQTDANLRAVADDRPPPHLAPLRPSKAGERS